MANAYPVASKIKQGFLSCEKAQPVTTRAQHCAGETQTALYRPCSFQNAKRVCFEREEKQSCHPTLYKGGKKARSTCAQPSPPHPPTLRPLLPRLTLAILPRSPGSPAAQPSRRQCRKAASAAHTPRGVSLTPPRSARGSSRLSSGCSREEPPSERPSRKHTGANPMPPPPSSSRPQLSPSTSSVTSGILSPLQPLLRRFPPPSRPWVRLKKHAAFK